MTRGNGNRVLVYASNRRPAVRVGTELDNFKAMLDLTPSEALALARELEKAARAARMIRHEYKGDDRGLCELCDHGPYAPQHGGTPHERGDHSTCNRNCDHVL